jgi:membrane protein required for colicin V production
VADRLLGFFYGLARGALVVCLIYLGGVMIFWPDIDSPSLLKDHDRNAPPELLMQARTRPLMAYGANELKVFVPKEMVDKEMKDLEAQKEQMEKAAQEQSSSGAAPSIPAPNEDKKSPVDVGKLFNGTTNP